MIALSYSRTKQFELRDNNQKGCEIKSQELPEKHICDLLAMLKRLTKILESDSAPFVSQKLLMN